MEQEVKFNSGNIQLSGTLRLPDSGDPIAFLLLLAGSGQLDRDENSKKIRINALKGIADSLASSQIASMRYDKRGVGESEGSYWDTGFFDNVADAESALRYLKSRPVAKGRPLFVLGHSEGALISTKLAAEHPELGGAVLIGGAARPGESVMRWQAVAVAKGMRGLNAFVIRLLHIEVAETQDKFLRKVKKSSKNWIREGLVRKMNAKWLREFMAYDPTVDLPNVRIPVLALTGSKDIQVDPFDLKKMSELVGANLEYHEIENMTHMLRPEDGQPSVSAYKEEITRPVDPRLLWFVEDWVTKLAGQHIELRAAVAMHANRA